MSDAPATPTLRLWDRLPCDSDASWEAFRQYRNQPTPRKLIRPGAGPTETLAAWYREAHWKERVESWDAYLDQIFQDECAAVVRVTAKEVAAAHESLLARARALASNELEKLIVASGDSERPGLMRPGDVTRLIESAVKLERLCRGDATERVEETDGKADLTKLSDDELAKMNELSRKARVKT